MRRGTTSGVEHHVAVRPFLPWGEKRGAHNMAGGRGHRSCASSLGPLPNLFGDIHSCSCSHARSVRKMARAITRLPCLSTCLASAHVVATWVVGSASGAAECVLIFASVADGPGVRGPGKSVEHRAQRCLRYLVGGQSIPHPRKASVDRPFLGRPADPKGLGAYGGHRLFDLGLNSGRLPRRVACSMRRMRIAEKSRSSMRVGANSGVIVAGLR